MAINTHQADHVEYIQDSDGNKHYLNAEYLDGHSYTDIKYTLPIANASDLGGVKSATTGTTANRDYKVQVNADGTMKVNVPWTDTDTKNTAGSTNDSSTLYLVGARTQVANSQTYSNSNVYMANGILTTKNIHVMGTDATVSGHLTIYGDNDDDDPKKPTDRTGISNSGGDVDAYYFNTGITLYDSVSENEYKLSFPGKTGTIALTSDIKTSVANHYTPAANSSAQLSVDASSKTAATWNSTSLVTGVNLQRDAKGHVTGVTVDSIKMPANPISGTHVNKGPYSADNNKDHIVYSGSSTANGNGNGCLIMVHGHIIYQSGYINITDTGTVYTDYDSYAVQAGQEGYWGKSWVTATAFFEPGNEPGKTMYVHAKGVESIYVVCIYF